MAIRARRLKTSNEPEKTELYEIRNSRNILVEEKQADGSLDQVTLEYVLGSGDVGYFAKEYRPAGIKKEGSKVIDITAFVLNSVENSVRWYLYDIKDTLAGEHTVVNLYNQWNSGLEYLQDSVLVQLQGYSATPDLGVITRDYDQERMERLRDKYQSICDDIQNSRQRMTLAQRKRRTNIANYKAILIASQAILDRKFHAERENNTYMIHIRQLCVENSHVYSMRLKV